MGKSSPDFGPKTPQLYTIRPAGALDQLRKTGRVDAGRFFDEISDREQGTRTLFPGDSIQNLPADECGEELMKPRSPLKPKKTKI